MKRRNKLLLLAAGLVVALVVAAFFIVPAPEYEFMRGARYGGTSVTDLHVVSRGATLVIETYDRKYYSPLPLDEITPMARKELLAAGWTEVPPDAANTVAFRRGAFEFIAIFDENGATRIYMTGDGPTKTDRFLSWLWQVTH